MQNKITNKYTSLNSLKDYSKSQLVQMVKEHGITMRADIKAAWLSDLRSGNLPQAAGALWRLKPSNSERHPRRGAGMCCLGVLCNVISSHKAVVTGFDFRWETIEQQGGVDNSATLRMFHATPCDEFGNPISNDESKLNDTSVSTVPSVLMPSIFKISDPKGRDIRALYSGLQGCLYSLNDSAEFTFAEIADIVEEYL